MTQTLAFLDGMNRPLDFHNDCRIPDGTQQNSILLTDFFDDNGWTSPINDSGSSYTVAGVGAMFRIGYSTVGNDTTDISTFGSRNISVYGVSYFLIAPDNSVIDWIGGGDSSLKKPKIAIKETHYDGSVHYKNPKDKGVSYGFDKTQPKTLDIKTTTKVNLESSNGQTFSLISKDKINSDENSTDSKANINDAQTHFWSNDPLNIAAIVGATNGAQPANAMIDQFRLIGAGFRFLPIVELVTNSDTFAVSRYYGANLTPTVLFNAASTGSDIYTIMREGSGYNEYTNAQGASARINSCQDLTYSLNKFTDISNWQNPQLDYSNVVSPVLVARFTSSVTVADGASFTAPFRSTFRIWLEAVLNLPTPLVTTRVPYEPGWELSCKAYVYDVINYPTIVPGHSFKKLTKSFFHIANALDPRIGAAVKIGTGLVRTGIKAGKLGKSALKDPNAIIRAAARHGANTLRNYNNMGLSRANSVRADFQPILNKRGGRRASLSGPPRKYQKKRNLPTYSRRNSVANGPVNRGRAKRAVATEKELKKALGRLITDV